MAKKILIIDDEQDILRLLEARLVKEGYEVFTAGNGMDGLKLAGEQKPNLIFLDILMPSMDGFDVCKEIKSNPELKEIPVLFLTSLEQIEQVKRGMTSGACGYIVKPFNMAELLGTIKDTIG